MTDFWITVEEPCRSKVGRCIYPAGHGVPHGAWTVTAAEGGAVTSLLQWAEDGDYDNSGDLPAGTSTSTNKIGEAIRIEGLPDDMQAAVEEARNVASRMYLRRRDNAPPPDDVLLPPDAAYNAGDTVTLDTVTLNRKDRITDLFAPVPGGFHEFAAAMTNAYTPSPAGPEQQDEPVGLVLKEFVDGQVMIYNSRPGAYGGVGFTVGTGQEWEWFVNGLHQVKAARDSAAGWQRLATARAKLLAESQARQCSALCKDIEQDRDEINARLEKALVEVERLRLLVGDQDAGGSDWQGCSRADAIRQCTEKHELFSKWCREHDARRDERDALQAKLDRINEAITE